MFDFLKAKQPPKPIERLEPVMNWTEFHDVPSSDAVRMGQIFGGYRTDSGAIVNERTAMRVSAVYRCVSLIGGAIATLPCSFYKKISPEVREKANDHSYWWLFNEEATPRFTAATFWEFITGQMLLRGDGIAYLVRANKYSPVVTGVIPVARDHVTIRRNGDRLSYTIGDFLKDGGYGYFTVDQDDVLHFPGAGFDGICSKSVISWAARQAIGIAIKADEHAAQTFGSGASIQYAVKSAKQMTQDQQENFRNAWVAKYSGQGVSQIPLVLTEGLEVQELSMTAVDAQLLESRKFQVVDIARAFGVPPHMLGETTASTSWGTGIEQMSIGFVKYTLQAHLNRFQQELNRKLFPRLDRYFVEFNVDGQLAGDSKTQSEYFSKALGGPGTQGWMVVNEVRRLKNLPPLPGGDELAKAGAAPAPKPPADNADNKEPTDEPLADETTDQPA
jgi:HK97 family phage portal protein